MLSSKLVRYIFTFILLGAFLLQPLPAKAQNGPASSHSTGGEKHLIDVTLSTDGAPYLGGTANMTFDVSPQMDAPKLTVRWIIPAGVTLLGPDTESFGAVAARQNVTSRRQLVFPSNGTYKIIAQGHYDLGANSSVAAIGVLFFTISPSGSVVSAKDPNAVNPNHSKIPSSPTILTASSPQAPDETPCFNIQGTIQRIDRPINKKTYGPNVLVPVRHAILSVRDSDTIFDDTEAETTTDENGHYSVSFCDDDGWFDNTLELYLRLRAEIKVGDYYVAEVEDSSWIDEVYEYDSDIWQSSGGSYTKDMTLNYDQSETFNIADAVLDAWDYWNASGGSKSDDKTFDSEAELHWEPGYGSDGSMYIPVIKEITIADDPTDPDGWDDAVIMHEWGHDADNTYSCDDLGSGDHIVDQVLSDPELSWSEGYPDYWQSAVRMARGDTYGSYYIDLDGTEIDGISLDLETWNVDHPELDTSLNEMSVAATLLDLNDDNNDGQDTVSYGHKKLQQLYTSQTFFDEAYGFWDDTCTFETYFYAWAKAGYPTNAATAAVLTQNVGYSVIPGTMQTNQLDAVDTTPPPTNLYKAKYWDQLAYVVDNSATMAGNKFNAAKNSLIETINDLGASPKGTEFNLFTFNNNSSQIHPVFAGQFFPSTLVPAVNSMTTSSTADNNCNVNALRALRDAVQTQDKGDAWLFTDGDTYTTNPDVEQMRSTLNERQIRASVALMGVCPIAQQAPTTALASPNPAISGPAQSFLGPAVADSTPGGIVPYLLTAINSGGQFLFVNDAQLPFAADILRAQITHSAGAGRWSDYVSNTSTYLYEKLASFEYNWIDAYSTGTNRGNPDALSGFITVNLPAPFTLYNEQTSFSSMRVYQNGYVSFGDYTNNSAANTTLPSTAKPNNTVYPLWGPQWPWNNICAPNQPSCGLEGAIYTQQVGDWTAVEYYEYESSDGVATYEVLFNPTNGEIRFQYKTVPGGSAHKTIGIENIDGTVATQIGYNDVTTIENGMGFKLTPVPPQPSKSYTVPVDSLMSGVGFLLTGYSGNFAPLAVTTPDGTPVSCFSSGVLCLNLGMVQYIQVDVNGRYGDWHAVVTPGSFGFGTYSFSSFAAGAMQPYNPGDHSLPSSGAQITVSMDDVLDGNHMTGRFQQPNGLPLGAAFDLYDDGLHGDGKAGDGRFGSVDNLQPGIGAAYLYITGEKGGVAFQRVETNPYTFQPVSVRFTSKSAFNYGGVTSVNVELKNLDTVNHCYDYGYEFPDGWWQNDISGGICINAGQTVIHPMNIYLSTGATNTLPDGTQGEVVFTLTEREKGIISDTDSLKITRVSMPDRIAVYNPYDRVPPNGGKAYIEYMVFSASGAPVADGTQVHLNTNLGGISPATAVTYGGHFVATFTSGATLGTATISAQTNNMVTGLTQIEISNPDASRVTLDVSTHNLPADGKSTASLTATALDKFGNPVANETVRIGVEGDGKFGDIGGKEVVTGTTDSQGQFTATFTASTRLGNAPIRAELVYGGAVVSEARQFIMVGSKVYLPVLIR